MNQKEDIFNCFNTKLTIPCFEERLMKMLCACEIRHKSTNMVHLAFSFWMRIYSRKNKWGAVGQVYQT